MEENLKNLSLTDISLKTDWPKEFFKTESKWQKKEIWSIRNVRQWKAEIIVYND